MLLAMNYIVRFIHCSTKSPWHKDIKFTEATAKKITQGGVICKRKEKLQWIHMHVEMFYNFENRKTNSSKHSMQLISKLLLIPG